METPARRRIDWYFNQFADGRISAGVADFCRKGSASYRAISVAQPGLGALPSK